MARKGYMYILKCSNNTFYTGSTKWLELRIWQHQQGLGANHTRKHGPVELVYFEEHAHIGLAFEREHQVKRWSHEKKKALIDSNFEKIHELAKCLNETSHLNYHPEIPDDYDE